MKLKDYDSTLVYADASRNHAGTISRACNQRATVAPLNLMVRPMRKWGILRAAHQRCTVSVVTLRMGASSETLRAASELRSLSEMDRGVAGVTGTIHGPSHLCGIAAARRAVSPLVVLPSRPRHQPRPMFWRGLGPIVIEAASGCPSKSRAQHGIRTDERLRRTPYRGFLREPGD